MNFLLLVISVVQGNLNSSTTVCEPGFLEPDASHQWSSISIVGSGTSTLYYYLRPQEEGWLRSSVVTEPPLRWHSCHGDTYIVLVTHVASLALLGGEILKVLILLSPQSSVQIHYRFLLEPSSCPAHMPLIKEAGLGALASAHIRFPSMPRLPTVQTGIVFVPVGTNGNSCVLTDVGYTQGQRDHYHDCEVSCFSACGNCWPRLLI